MATVDHGLRAESAGEAAGVAARCRALGLPAAVLRWQGWDGQGNLQDAARQARRGLLADWAAAEGVQVVLTGHTADDQAETVLLRLARGSGVDGLSGIAPVSFAAGLAWGRPLLRCARADLRALLVARDIAWVEDPSNDDSRFDRVKARRLLAQLDGLGLSVERLAATAERMRDAGAALAQAADSLARHTVRQDRGDLVLNLAAMRHAPADLQRRLVAAALQWVSGQPYRPRYAALLQLIEAMGEGRDMTLHGCLALQEGRGGARITREARAVQGRAAVVGAPWDGRWIVTGPAQPDDRVQALGAAVADLPDWRASGLPRASLAASPAVWRGGTLVAAPLAGHGDGWSAHLAEGRADFPSDTFAH